MTKDEILAEIQSVKVKNLGVWREARHKKDEFVLSGKAVSNDEIKKLVKCSYLRVFLGSWHGAYPQFDLHDISSISRIIAGEDKLNHQHIEAAYCVKLGAVELIEAIRYYKLSYYLKNL